MSVTTWMLVAMTGALPPLQEGASGSFTVQQGSERRINAPPDMTLWKTASNGPLEPQEAAQEEPDRKGESADDGVWIWPSGWLPTQGDLSLYPAASAYQTAFVVRTDEQGQARYWLHGQEIPSERVRRDGTRLVLEGKDGQLAAQLEVDDAGRIVLPSNATLSLASPPQPPRPVLGVRVGSMEPLVAAQLGLDAERGVVITGVDEGQPAARAGVERYDILLAIDGHDVTVENLPEVVGGKAIGSSVTLELIRAGERTEIEVVLGQGELRQSSTFLFDSANHYSLGFDRSGTYFVAPGTGSTLFDPRGPGFYSDSTKDGPSYYMWSQRSGSGPTGQGGDEPALGDELARLRAALDALEKTLQRLETERR